MKDNVIGELINSIKEAPEEPQNAYSAVVSKVDSEGVVWVHLAGSDKETPTASTSAEIKSGDIVTVEWRNNKLYIAGNYSNPSAGTERVVRVEAAAQNAENTANNAEATAQSAQESAAAAHQIAANTEQHFWFTETGEDTGAHITEVTQEEWNDPLNDNYQSGGNLLARSNGIAVRDGLEEIASLGVEGVTIGKSGSGQTILEDDGIMMLTPEGATAFEVKSGTGSSVKTVTKTIGQEITVSRGNSVTKTYAALGLVSSGDTFDLTVMPVTGNSSTQIDHVLTFTKGTSETKSWTVSIGGTVTIYVAYNGGTQFTFSIFALLTSLKVTLMVKYLKYSYNVLDARVDVNGDLYIGKHGTPVGYVDSDSGTESVASGNVSKTLDTITLSAGTWLVIGRCSFPTNTTGRRFLHWYNITGDNDVYHSYCSSPPASGYATNLQSIMLANPAVSTKYELRAQSSHTSGSLSVSWNWTLVRIA